MRTRSTSSPAAMALLSTLAFAYPAAAQATTPRSSSTQTTRATRTHATHSRATASNRTHASAPSHAARPVQPASSASRAANAAEITAASSANLPPDIRQLRFRGRGGGLEVQIDEHHFVDVDGGRLDVRVSNERSSHQTWRVIGGMVALTTGGYASIDHGELHLERSGNSWSLAGGTLLPVQTGSSTTTLETPAHTSGDSAGSSAHSASAHDAEPTTPADPSVSGNAHADGPVTLPDRTLAALDRLMSLAPAGSRDAIRLASATEVTIHNAQSADPTVFTTPIVGRSVVLVIDTSYSMRDRDPAATDASIDPSSPPSKLDVAKAELVRMLASLPAGTLVNIVAFSSEAQAMWSEPRAIDDATLDQAIHWVASLAPGDVTDPIPALRMADAMHPDQIVFVTDGRPTDREADDQVILALASTIASHRARLDIVGIGQDQDAPFLDSIASRGAGVARHR